MNNAKLAAYLAREIFRVGDESNDKVQRIQYKGGRWPDHETNLGGLCETALIETIMTALDSAAVGKSE